MEKGQKYKAGLYEESCKNGIKESCDVFKWTYALSYNIWGANAHKAKEQAQSQKAYMSQLIDEYRATCGDDRDILTLITKHSLTLNPTTTSHLIGKIPIIRNLAYLLLIASMQWQIII